MRQNAASYCYLAGTNDPTILFDHHDKIADDVRRHVDAVGVDASQFADHSLRSDLATLPSMAVAPERSVMVNYSNRILLINESAKNGAK